MTFGHRQEQVFLGRDIGRQNDYSEKVAAQIDGEIRRFIDEAYEGTVKLLNDNMDKLHLIAKNLMERETLEGHEIEELLKYGHILEKGEVPPQEEPEKPADGTPAPVGPLPAEEPAEAPVMAPVPKEVPEG